MAEKIKPNTDHRTIEGDYFVCKNCGAMQTFPNFPLEILKFTRMMDKFLTKHQNCKPK